MPFEQLPIRIETSKGQFSIDVFKPGDEARMIVLLNIPSIAQNLYSPPSPFTQSDADKAIVDSNKILELPHGDNLPTRMAIRDDAGLLQGGLGFRYVSADTLNIGYYLAPEVRGHKILHAAIKALLPFFTGLCIEGLATVSNRGSQRVLLESGFEQVPGISEWLVFPESKGGDRRPLLKYLKYC